MEDVHEHRMPDGTVIVHAHTHTHTQTKAVLNRMSRLIGHLQSIKRMVEEGRDCSEVLVQLSAVDAAIRGVSKVILKDHMEHSCPVIAHVNSSSMVVAVLCLNGLQRYPEKWFNGLI